MKHVLPAVVASLLLATAVSAEEAAPQTVKADTPPKTVQNRCGRTFRRRASVTAIEQSVFV